MTRTFRLSADDELKEAIPSTLNNAFGPMPPIPSSLAELQELMKSLDDKMGAAMGVPSTYLMHPGNYTAAVYGMQLDRSVIQTQKMMNGINNSLRNMLNICIDPYMPKTVRRQFRFPRSKKKRIRKKWAKDQRNWKDFNVIFAVNPRAFQIGVDPSGKETLFVKRETAKQNAVLYF